MPTPIPLQVIPYDASGDDGFPRSRDPRFDKRTGPADVPKKPTSRTTDSPSNSSAGPEKRTRKLSEIKSKLLRPSLTSHYVCSFAFPQLVQEWTKQKGTPYTYKNQDLLQLSCSEAALPGSSLMTHEINNDFSGVTERHAYRRAYDERASFTFYVDYDYTIIKLFENWMSFIAGEQYTSAGDRPGIVQPEYFYRMRYPEQYQTNSLYITKFERDYENTGVCLEYRFLKAFPISIVTMPVRYEASELLKCTVNFTYSRYTIDSRKLPVTKTKAKAEKTNPQPSNSVDLNNFAGVPVPLELRPILDGFGTGGAPSGDIA